MAIQGYIVLQRCIRSLSILCGLSNLKTHYGGTTRPSRGSIHFMFLDSHLTSALGLGQNEFLFSWAYVADPTNSSRIHDCDYREATTRSTRARRTPPYLPAGMNRRDFVKKEPENNSSRIWGRFVEATTTARQKVADKYYDIREGGNGTPRLLILSPSPLKSVVRIGR